MALAYVTALSIQDTLLIRQTCGSGLSGWFSSVCSYVTIGGHKTVDYVVFCLITAYAFCSSCTILLGFCCFQPCFIFTVLCFVDFLQLAKFATYNTLY